ncbi:DUF1508 domain-containing protein [Neorhizobium sp. P12A]|nr:DUF1508 domain-containing protein [Neorhizobium sp. P12A]
MFLSCKDANGDKWEIYLERDGWRWSRKASNGRLVGASPQAYADRYSCIENARRNGMQAVPT